MHPLQRPIEQLFEQRHSLTPATVTAAQQQLVKDALALLNTGELRVAEKIAGEWKVHEWLKKAVLLFFRLADNRLIGDGANRYFDKVPLKFSEFTSADFAHAGVRVVPPAHVRYGAYLAPNTVLMPSYINIGAYVDSGTLVDTWATVGSCAQIGKNVHLSGGVGIGGVLEPLQAKPTIIEDECFIGARSEIVEGVIVETGAVIGMGVYLGQSTKIYDRTNGQISYGRVPAGAVVVPGALPAPDASHSLYCAVIVKYVDEKTRRKTAINELLRSID